MLTHRAYLRRMLLQLERDLLHLARLKTLVVKAKKTVRVRRRDVRNLKARIKRYKPKR